MRQRRQLDSPEIPIAPMIDCVFLMLVYFMTTSSLEKSEAELICPAGHAGLTADPLPAVDEQSLQISADGVVVWNGSQFGLFDLSACQQLTGRLAEFKLTCKRAGSDPSLRLLPDAAAPHQAVVSLLDSITRSGIEQVHFR